VSLIIGLKGERVRLVPPDRDLHLENAIRWWNDPEVGRFLVASLGMTRGMAEEWFERVQGRERIHATSWVAPSGLSREFVWAVLDDQDQHIGFAWIHNIDWRYRVGVTGTVIGEKSAWSKGYGSEAMKLRAQFAFEVLGLHRLEADAIADNIGSVRALERAGYRREGVARQKVWARGKWHDLVLLGMLEEDYVASRGSIAKNAGVTKQKHPHSRHQAGRKNT
jgi:RimJ/RimL family protein N-acetyltransferase